MGDLPVFVFGWCIVGVSIIKLVLSLFSVGLLLFGLALFAPFFLLIALVSLPLLKVCKRSDGEDRIACRSDISLPSVPMLSLMNVFVSVVSSVSSDEALTGGVKIELLLMVVCSYSLA